MSVSDSSSSTPPTRRVSCSAGEPPWEAAPRDLTTFLILGAAARGRPAVAHVYGVANSADPDTVVDRFTPVTRIAPLLNQQLQLMPYAAVMNAPDAAHRGQGGPVARSGLIEHVTPEFAAAAAALLDAGTTHFFQLRALGGAVADTPEDATAYSHRSANFSVVAFGASKQRLDAAWSEMSTHFAGLYLSFETDQSSERLTEAWPPATLSRLRALKMRYDPTNVFRDNFNIDPLGD